MVLTDRQRSDLHAGIHEYLLSRSKTSDDAFAVAARAMHDADPEACRRNDTAAVTTNGSGESDGAKSPPGDEKASGRTRPSPRKVGGGGTASGGAPLLEKKWTAVPRLQKRILELERSLASSARNPGAAGAGVGATTGDAASASAAPGPGAHQRRMLPRANAPASHTLTGHTGVVNSVAVHPSYTLAASASEDGTVKLWDCESGDFVRTLRGHTAPVNCVAFDQCSVGNKFLLVSCGSDLTIKIWELEGGGTSGGCKRTLRGHDHTVSAVVFLPPKREAADASATGGATAATTGPNGATSGGGGGGGGGATHLLSASRDGTVKQWEVESGFCVHTYNDAKSSSSSSSDCWIRCLAVRRAVPGGNGGAPAPTLIASGGNDGVINLWNEETKKTVGELRGHEHVVESVAFSFVTTTSTNSVKPTSKTKVSAAAAPPYDTTTLLVSGSRDRTVRLWNVVSLECLSTLSCHENWVRDVVLHPGGRYVLSAGDDRTIRVLDLKSNRCLRTIDNAHGHFVTSIAMHATLPILVSGGVDQTVKCWSLE